MALEGLLHKIVWGGPLAVTESWSCSLHFIAPATAVLDTTLIQTALEEWFVRDSTKINLNAKLEFLKVNQVRAADGLYVDGGNPRTFHWPAPLAGSAVQQNGDPASTVCVSTGTAVARGLGSKGRFFPPTVTNGQPDGRQTAGESLAQATSAAQLITDINGSNPGECYVWSQKGQVQHAITFVRVGRVVDHQLRRRKNLVEDYQKVDVA
jgi:hypothetical protein